MFALHKLAACALTDGFSHLHLENLAKQLGTTFRFVLRNWMAQEAIQAAEAGNYNEAQDLLKLVTDPFTTVGEDGIFAHALAVGAWLKMTVVRQLPVLGRGYLRDSITILRLYKSSCATRAVVNRHREMEGSYPTKPSGHVCFDIAKYHMCGEGS
eukprot:1139821-Pelagomonas_calceolata.AAC.3